jgi:TolB-like protein
MERDANARPTDPPPSERLETWKEIAVYLKRDPRTVQRWEKTEGLPVHRHLHDKLGTVYAFRSELDTWWNQRRVELESQADEVPADEAPTFEYSTAASNPAPQPSFIERRMLLGIVVGASLLAGAYLAWTGLWPRVHRAKVKLAVLPLDNLNKDPSQDYFSDSLTEQMISELGRLQPDQLGVIAWTTVKTYKGSGKSVKQIGQELNVQYVLEGSVVRAGDRIRVNAQLIEVKDETHMRVEVFERPFTDILNLQNDLAVSVARSLALELLPEEEARLAQARPIRPEAYEAYLKGRYLWGKRAPEDLQQAITLFQEVVSREPQKALGYAGLADALSALGFYSIAAPKDSYAESRKLILRAIELDDSLAEAHTSLADILYVYDYDWEGAEREFRRAIQLNPSYPNAHHWYSVYLVLRGRKDESLREIERALELDPRSVSINSDLALHYFYTAQYDAAIEQARKTLAMDPSFAMARFWLGRSLFQQGKHKEGISELERILTEQPGHILAQAVLGNAYGISGQPAKARRVAREMEAMSSKRYVSPTLISLVYAGLGDKNKTITFLEEGYNLRDALLTRAKADPVADSIRNDPHFQDLLKRVGPP